MFFDASLDATSMTTINMGAILSNYGFRGGDFHPTKPFLALATSKADQSITILKVDELCHPKC